MTIGRSYQQCYSGSMTNVAVGALWLLCYGAATIVAQELCISPTNTFTTVVDLFAGELGYYTFVECPGLLNPTIGLEVGQTYMFDQSDRSNWYHPLGFAYFPDGAHDAMAELEPAVSLHPNNDCAATFSCSTPFYYLDGVLLGVPGTSDFGLDAYEPAFFYPIPEWEATGSFSVALTFTDQAYTNDIFYFCHIHQLMSGRIKLLKNGMPLNPDNTPPIEYEYDVISEFDAGCGTFGLDPFQLPNANCPDKFVCTTADTSPALKQFSSCIDAMNCFMMDGMTTGVRAESDVALFLHQMIPHHQNAVNMAKVLLFQGNLNQCAALEDDTDPLCVMEVVIRDIINTQNFQIQQMRGILDALNYKEADNCSVLVETTGIALDKHGTTPTAATPSNEKETTVDESAATQVTSKAEEKGKVANLVEGGKSGASMSASFGCTVVLVRGLLTVLLLI